MNYFLAKQIGIEAVSNLDFMSRPGIFWKWRSKGFSGVSFGTSLIVTHCFFSSGFHEFGHAVDFIMRGKASRVSNDGLIMSQKYLKYIPQFNIYDGVPRTSQMTRSEARAFAFEAYFQKKEMGYILQDIPSERENILLRDGLFDHLPKKPVDNGHIGYLSEYRLLEKCTVEEFAHSKRRLEHLAWDDRAIFMKEMGYEVDYNHFQKTREEWKDAFERAILDEYARLNNPFVERRISRAITELGERLRRFQKAKGFVPTDDFIGLRSSRLISA